MKYDFTAIEKKWQARWEETKPYAAVTGSDKPKFYGLIEFPYPSGAGTACRPSAPLSPRWTSSARKKRMEGYNVLFPIGFDAFGLPTENYAIKNHIHPADSHQETISQASPASSRCWATASTGTARSIPPTRSIISGRSGFSSSCSRTVLPTRPTCPSTGAPPASACLQTKRS